MDLFIKECFKKLGERNPSIYTLNTEQLEKKYNISAEMIQDQIAEKTTGTWQLMKSSVTAKDILELEKELDVTFPELYKAFISTYAHLITILTGRVDHIIFDDEEVTLEIPVQPYHRELEDIKNILIGHKKLLDAGYLLIGECDSHAVLCIDLAAHTEAEMPIVFFDDEDLCQCMTREEFENVREIIFDNFKQLLECFFIGIQ